MTTKHLDGKVAIITGGAGGIGSWLSRVFAEQGAKVVVADTGADVEGRMGTDPTRDFTSGAGLSGSAGQPNYSAAHNAKLGLMRSNARTLERYGVTCD